MDRKQLLFAEYRLDPGNGLVRNGERIPLAPRESRLLWLLASLEGQIATHREIERVVWAGETMSYAALTKCVSSIRRKLGDKDRTIVAAVAKRGYRIGVPVRTASDGKHGSVKPAEVRPEALSYYLEGLRQAGIPRPATQEHAVAMFEAAARIEPDYAAAWAAIADVRIMQALRGFLRPADAYRLGRSACAQALSIEPDLVAANASLGWLEGAIRRDVAGGLARIDRALEADPTHVVGHLHRGSILVRAGRCDDAVEATRTAYELDPASRHFVVHVFAQVLFCNGRAREALELERAVCDKDPPVDAAYAYRANFASHLGLHDEAIASAREAVQISDNDPAVVSFLALALGNAGQCDEGREWADEAARGLLPRAPRSLLAMAYTALGDRDTAVACLIEAREEGCPWFGAAPFDPRLAPLHADPRFGSLYA